MMSINEYYKNIQDAFSASNIPDVEKGEARISSFEVARKDAEFHNLRSIINGAGYAEIRPGSYKRLHVNGILMMSDTPMEYKTNIGGISSAKGHTLVLGMGLGCFSRAAFAAGKVDKMTILEKSQDVIDLVAPSLSGLNVDIICADAFSWKWRKGEKFDYVWHDIWPDICEDNKPEMTKLKRKFGRISGGNQDCWSDGYWRY